MNYYKRHLGDYAKDAGHLSLIEHGVFNLLLDRYYNTERPITDAEAIRVCRARAPEEVEAVSAVLREFFVAGPDGWTNKRADQEIAGYREQAETNRRIAMKREETKRARPVDEACTDGSPEACALREPSHKPLAIKESKADNLRLSVGSEAEAAENSPPECPHAEIIAAYHSALPELPRVRVWDAGRQGYLRQRWREDPERQSLAWWKEFFGYVRRCPFLLGQQTAGHRDPFLADLEWLVRPANFRKVIEGRYERRDAA